MRSKTLFLLALITLVFAIPFGKANAQTYNGVVNASTDDVNEDGTIFTTNTLTWLGTGATPSASFLGLRFNNVTVPKNSTITSATLQVFSPFAQSQSFTVNIAGDAVGNSATFDSSSKPSQRTLTTATVNQSDSSTWLANSYNPLSSVSTVVQELVNRSDWSSGNSLSFIIKGSGLAYNRKFIESYDGNSSHSAQLSIAYDTPTPTPTPTDTPTPTPVPTYQVSGTVYVDTNLNGVQDVGESGLQNVQVAINTSPVQIASTSATGDYAFNNISAATYTVTANIPSGYVATTTNPVVVAVANNTAVNFGLALAPTNTPTPTDTPTPTPTNTPTPTPTSTPTPTPTPVSLTKQIVASADDVNQDGSPMTTNVATVFLGTGGSTTSSYTGLRFTNVTIPHNATIVSAVVQVYSVQSQSVGINMNIAADASGNSAAFTSSTKPSTRTLTSNVISYSNSSNWATNTWYSLSDMSSVVQEIVNRGDWTSGNAMTVIMKGTGTVSDKRRYVQSYDGSHTNAPKLIITYR